MISENVISLWRSKRLNESEMIHNMLSRLKFCQREKNDSFLYVMSDNTSNTYLF
jgi:hypothetical protein